MSASPLWLWLAAAAAFVSFLAHTLVGTKEIARPLLAADMATIPKYVNFFCWHLVTISLAVTTLSFALAAAFPSAWELGAMATLIAVASMIWGLGLVAWSGRSTGEMPQWILFAIISAFGVAAFAVGG